MRLTYIILAILSAGVVYTEIITHGNFTIVFPVLATSVSLVLGFTEREN